MPINPKTTFFNEENIAKRIFFILGQTADVFFHNNKITNKPEKQDFAIFLHNHLKENGFERIVFYNFDRKIYFQNGDTQSEQLFKITKRNINLNGIKKNLLGPQFDYVLTSKLFMKEYPLVEVSDNKELNSGIRSDAASLKAINNILRDSKIKTAVIFDNADDYLTHFSQQYGNDFNAEVNTLLNSWKNLPTENFNVVILVFNPSSIQEIQERYKNNFLWNTYLSPMFKEPDINKNILRVPNPSYGEIKIMLDYYIDLNRIEKLESNDEATIIKLINTYIYRYKTDLKSVFMVLSSLKEKLTISNLMTLFKQNEEPSSKTMIKELIGMKTFKATMETLEVKSRIDHSLMDTKFIFTPRLSPETITETKKAYNLNFALIGNPGTGKTTVANLMGKFFKEMNLLPSGHLVKVNRSDLVAGYVGQTAIKTQQMIDKALGGVLFIDEAYSLYKGDSNQNDFGEEAISTIVENMTYHEGNLSVIIAGYPTEIKLMLEKANPGLTRRFKEIIEIEDYSIEELIDVFKYHCINKGYEFESTITKFLQTYLATKKANSDNRWGNADESVKLVDYLYDLWCRYPDRISKGNRPFFTLSMLPEKDLYLLNNSNQEPTIDNTLEELNKLIGLKEVKDKIKILVNNYRMGNNTTEPGHFLFIGNPGTGKTTVARLLGKILKNLRLLPTDKVLETHPSDFIASYVGQSEQKTTDLLNKAKNGVLLIDEAYALAKNDFGKSALDKIVKFMEDNRGTICVIMTGYAFEMDELMNQNSGLKSRFSNIINFSDYSVFDLISILNLYAKTSTITISKLYYSKFQEIITHARLTKNFGNGRFVRQFFENSVGLKNNRLIKQFGDPEKVPLHLKNLLLPDDIQYKGE